MGAAVEALVDAVLACGPEAVRLQKALMIRWRESDLPAAIRAGVDAFARAYATREPQEGTAAFLARRPPRFGSAP
ncbi:MAG TPA: hypothetical protein VFX28_05780 [Methylomirabilota bacterium]|nr:hypothetical protein [Methylomirabilota bacterium]